MMEKAADNFLEEEIYTAQHYGLTATGFVAYLYRALAISLDKGLGDLEVKILGEVTDEHEEIKVKMRDLRSKIMEYFSIRMDHYFNFLEEYLRDVLTIPDHVVLPQDQVHLKVDYSDEKDKEADRLIEEKRIRLKGIFKAKAAFHRELKELKDSQALIEGYVDELRKLRGEEEHCQPLNIRQIFEDVQALQRSVAAVQQIRNVALPR